MVNNELDEMIARMNVLVVEDESTTRTMIDFALRSLSIHQITMANNGIQAIAEFESSTTKFNLIVCDWIMPEMDGLEFLKGLRAKGHKIKFLMLTSKATMEDVSVAIKAGADSYITKPFSVQSFQQKLRAIAKSMV